MVLCGGVGMKYIRTKDKIYGFIPNVVSSIEYDDEVGAYSIYYFDENKGKHLERDDKGGHSMDSVWNEDIVKQADTIEELCDEFVCDHNNGTRVIQTKVHKPQFPFCEDTIDYLKRNNQTYYGAIWTDKGLIYVAKMNNKGELELL